jgi:hypothetical protein
VIFLSLLLKVVFIWLKFRCQIPVVTSLEAGDGFFHSGSITCDTWFGCSFSMLCRLTGDRLDTSVLLRNEVQAYHGALHSLIFQMW